MNGEEYLRENLDALRQKWLERYEEEMPQYTFSEKHEVRMAEMIRDAEPKKQYAALPVLRKAAAVVAVMVTILALSIVASVPGAPEEYGTDILRWTQQEFPQYIEFRYRVVGRIPEGDKSMEIGWLPEGFVEIRRTGGKALLDIFYENADGDRLNIYFSQIREFKYPSFKLDIQNAVVRNLEINGDPALLIEKENMRVLRWTIDNYICTVKGELSEASVVKIAENIERR